MVSGSSAVETESKNPEVQQWKTLHPVRRQECADRRPLLQQSGPDLRLPGPMGHPMHRRRCPRVCGNRSLDTMAPGAALSSSDPSIKGSATTLSENEALFDAPLRGEHLSAAKPRHAPR